MHSFTFRRRWRTRYLAAVGLVLPLAVPAAASATAVTTTASSTHDEYPSSHAGWTQFQRTR